MKLLDYIRGLRKGKEAHRLEKESMKDPFLADAIDGYHQVKGNHEQQIRKLQAQVSAHSAKKKNSYAITWSVAACLVIGIGISSYFLFLKKNIGEDIFSAKENSSLIAQKPDSDSVHITTNRPIDKKEKIAKVKQVSRPDSPPVAMTPVREESSIAEELGKEVIAITDADTSVSEYNLNEKKSQLSEVVVVGYGTQKKRKITGAVSTVSRDTLKVSSDTLRDTLIPEPTIGMNQYKKYLKKNLIRPDDTCAKAHGKVILTFLVNKERRPYDIKVKKSLCESSDKEAIRLIQEGPDWTYGTRPMEITVNF